MVASFLLVLALAATPAPSEASPVAPWDGEPFAGDPKAIGAAAAKLDAPEDDGPTDLLLEELRITLDERGRETRAVRYVYVLRKQKAADDWIVNYAYNPWIQARPEVRARVIARDGSVRTLDPGTLSETPVASGEGEERVYRDVRAVRAPLPGLSVGAVVEEQGIVRTVATRYDGPELIRLFAARPAPVRRFRVRVEAPVALPLLHRTWGLPKPRETVDGGRRVLLWEEGPRAAVEEPAPYSPPDQVRAAGVALATGTAWRDVARAYAALVDRQLQGAALEPLARTIVSGRDSADVAAQKVLEWIRARVRYTGLSLGEAAIVPARPSETLERGYGDCKDLSTLAVGLLRAAGHRASVALVSTGLEELDPELPGLGWFDHALVRVEGRRPVWLDPAFDGAAAGELGAWTQGRLALVAAPETTALVRTDETAPGSDVVVKTRTLTLPEQGAAHALEESEFRGLPAVNVHAFAPTLAGAGAVEHAKERLNAAEATNASAKVELRTGGRAGVARLRVEADASRWAVVDEDEAVALVSPHPVFARLPPVFRIDVVGGKDVPDAPTPRTTDVLLLEPYQATLTYRVHPPPGFRLRELPEGEKLRIGPASYESAFRTERDGSITATYRFVTGARRLAPKVYEELWRVVADRTREDGPRITFERTSTALLAEGQGREALAEIDRLVALHPAEARHHAHRALALVQLGLGEPARVSARRAAELEPKNAWAHHVVAWTLEHDALGRQLAAGSDLAGAVAAQRRAVELSPKDPQMLAHLGWLLSHGAGARRFGPGAPLDEAIRVLGSARELRPGEFDADLMSLLAGAGRGAEALAIARELPASERRNAAVVVTATLAGGGAAGAREVQRLEPGLRLDAIRAANADLLALRRYELAAALTERAAGGSGGAAQLREAGAWLARMRRVEDVRLDPKDPAALYARLLATLAQPDPDAAFARLIVSRRRPPASGDGGEGRAMIAGMRNAIDGKLPNLDTEVLVDLALAMSTARAEGTGPWRVLVTMIAGPMASKPLELLVVQEGGELRLGAISPQAPAYAAEALRCALAGDLPAARRLLAWAREASGTGGVLDRLWTSGDAAGAEELARAAAVVAAPAEPDVAFPVLRREREGKRGGDAAQETVRAALAFAIGAPNGVGEPALLDELEREDPSLKDLCRTARLRALARKGRHAELRALATERLRAAPGDENALRALAGAASQLSDFAAAVDAHRRLSASTRATPGDFNNGAWTELFTAAVRPEALDLARRAVQRKDPGLSAAQHTLATVHAALDQPAEAIEVLRKGLDVRQEPAGAKEWLVLGRVAQSYGLLDVAAGLYRRAAKDPDPSPASMGALARRWLEALPASARGKEPTAAR